MIITFRLCAVFGSVIGLPSRTEELIISLHVTESFYECQTGTLGSGPGNELACGMGNALPKYLTVTRVNLNTERSVAHDTFMRPQSEFIVISACGGGWVLYALMARGPGHGHTGSKCVCIGWAMIRSHRADSGCKDHSEKNLKGWGTGTTRRTIGTCARH